MEATESKPKRKPKKLDTLGDVERQLARLYHRVDRRSLKRLDRATVLRQILEALAAVMQDKRDSIWVGRAQKMWKQLNPTQQKPPDAIPSSNH